MPFSNCKARRFEPTLAYFLRFRLFVFPPFHPSTPPHGPACFSFLTSPLAVLETGSLPPSVPAAPIAVKDIGKARDTLSIVLEAIARGTAGFTIKIPVDPDAADGVGGDQAIIGGGGPYPQSAVAAPSGNTAADPSVGGNRQGTRRGDGPLLEMEGQAARGGGSVGSLAGKDGSSLTKYRTSRTIDTDIMTTIIAEVTPVAVASGDRGPPRAPAGTGCRDACAVHGPEMEWGSVLSGRTGTTCDTDTAALMKALIAAKEEGMTLSQIRNARCYSVNANSGGVQDVELASLGSALRSGAVVCVCGVEDIR